MICDAEWRVSKLSFTFWSSKQLSQFCCDNDITHQLLILCRLNLCSVYPPVSSSPRVLSLMWGPDVRSVSRTVECCHVGGEGGVSTASAASLPPSHPGLWLVSWSSSWSAIGGCLTPNSGLIWGHRGNMMLRVMFPGLCQNSAIYRYETRPSINPLNWGHNNCMGHLLLRCRVPFLQLWFSSFCHEIREP